MGKKILVVDDDPHIREVVAFAVEKAGMGVLQAADGAQALDMARQHKPDLIVLDISMPELDGLEVCRTLRKSDDTPILFLSSRDEEVDRIIGLELGGDDYVTKPFSPRELVARINAILKRRTAPASKEADAPQKLNRGGVMLDTASYTATCGAQLVPLTATEFMLLLALFRSPERVFTRDELMDRAYGDITVSDRTIDSHIRRVRQKFAAQGFHDVVATSHGIGYKLGTCL
ncbi:MAG TPA: response regulator transcription factor [Patescibacteria group bacterium]|nr:response regulator transcription factor [Patescibacteria group bacterium]